MLDRRWFLQQALSQEAPVFHTLAHSVVNNDKFWVVAHGHVKRREEGAAAWYCERRVLQLARQFLELVNGGLSLFEELSDQLTYVLALFDRELYCICLPVELPPKDFLFCVPYAFACNEFLKRDRVKSVMPCYLGGGRK